MPRTTPWLRSTAAALLALAATPLLGGLDADEPPTLALGTYDSRAVAVAFVRSELFGEYLRAQQEDLTRASARARAQGDESLAEALDALGPAMQERVHLQGFGTAPVDDVLALVADEVPAVAEAAGVGALVSRWALDWKDADAAPVAARDLRGHDD